MLRNPDEAPSASNPSQGIAPSEYRRRPRWTFVTLAVIGLAGLWSHASDAAPSKTDTSVPKKSLAITTPANATAKKPAVAQSGTALPRLQAANAGMAASVKQLKAARGTTVAQRAANLRLVARSQSRGGYGISCVPYARGVTGMSVSGNAWQWWNSAAGTYERGARPEAGSVLNFRSTGRMRLGHVAVVARVVNRREIEIDHANWSGGGVARGVAVIDVSEANDWSAVRVGLGGNGNFGSIYPTYGFIYNRADHGVMVANAPDVVQPKAQFQQIAEAPAPRVVRAYIDAANGGGR